MLRDKMRKVKLAVGRDGRNRTVLWPFKAKTSRTQPKASEWIFSPAVWLRSLIKPGPGMAVAYHRLFEHGILNGGVAAPTGTAGRSTTCSTCTEAAIRIWLFASALARCQAQPPRNRTRAVRDKYKTMLLAVQYGMARGNVGRSAWRLNVRGARNAQSAPRDNSRNIGPGRTIGCSTRCRPGSCARPSAGRAAPVSPNSTSGRFAIGRCRRPVPTFCGSPASWRHRHGIKLLAPVHDAVLIEAPIERIEADVALMREIMRRASRIVLNASGPARTSCAPTAPSSRYPDRYSDKRGVQIWTKVFQLLTKEGSSKGSVMVANIKDNEDWGGVAVKRVLAQSKGWRN